MDLFLRAKTVRLRSYKDKYLIAEENRETVSQDRDGSSQNALWTVEYTEGKDCIRLKSCYDTYLTASSDPFLPGTATKKKVVQSAVTNTNQGDQWEPLRDGMQARLRSLWGHFLRPNGGLPPWRNSITHDIPHWSKTLEKVLWDVEVVETRPIVHRRTLSDTTFSRTRSTTSMISRNKVL